MAQKNYLIIGGTGGIGQDIIQQLLQANSNSSDNDNESNLNNNDTIDSIKVFATYHRRDPASTKNILAADNLHWLSVDVSSENSIQKMAAEIEQHSTHIDWVINCVGLLHNEQMQPEKSLRQLETEMFLQSMQVNALASLLIAKHVKPLLAKATRSVDNPAIYATISARVGSISDNQLGGWYSYRMSKAALNMGMKNLSIEWGRALKNICVVVMQPGTVNTQLSAPFQGNVADGKLFTPDYSSKRLLEVLGTMTAAQSGSFVDWAGKSIPW